VEDTAIRLITVAAEEVITSTPDMEAMITDIDADTMVPHVVALHLVKVF